RLGAQYHGKPAPAGEGKRPLAKGSGVPHARRRPHRATTGARPVQRAAGSLLRHGASNRARRSRSREGMIQGRARQFPALWFESSPAELFTRARVAKPANTLLEDRKSVV